MKKMLLTMAIAAGLVASGCTGLGTLNRAAQPYDLYALTPKSTFSSSLPRISQQIVLNEPTATAAVDTDQIVIQPTPLQVQYLPQARWVDRAPLIVQALLVESFENTGRVTAIGKSSVALRADYVIVTDVREFQAILPRDDTPDEALDVLVGINLKIVYDLDDAIIASKSFEEKVRSQSDAPADIVQSFDEALGDVMRDAVEWSIRRVHAHASARPKAVDPFAAPPESLPAPN